MPELSNIKKELATLDQLKQALNLKQSQLNILLSLTQAINNNVKKEPLFNMYKNFLTQEMKVRKLALYVREHDDYWTCVTHVGFPDALLDYNVSSLINEYAHQANPNIVDDHPLISQFDIGIPVAHKDVPIAYVFIGGFDIHDDRYEKLQFITTITNVVAVAIENKRLFKQQLEQERIQRELELGSEMQLMLVPARLPNNKEFQLDSIYRPHSSIGGDYFDYIGFSNRRFAFCIADISGKGVAAALLMANFQANLHSLIHRSRTKEDFVRELNRAVLRTTKGERFITFFFAEFDLETRCLTYVNAGHIPPVLVRPGSVTRLTAGCTILGMFPDLPELETGSIVLDDEALVFSFTDGLTDIANDGGEYFSEELVEAFARDNAGLPVREFNARLMEQINLFKGDRSYPDDFTVLACKIFAPRTAPAG